MERISNLACAGVQSLRKISQWTQKETGSQQQRLGGANSELRPRKRARRNGIEPEARPGTVAHSPRFFAEPTVTSSQINGNNIIEPTPTPTGLDRRQDGGLAFDTVGQPSKPDASQSFQFTGSTVAGSLGVAVPGSSNTVQASASNVVVTQTAAASAAPAAGMSVTTEAIIISCSIAGTLVIVTLITLLGICYRRRKRRQNPDLPLGGMPRRMQSSSTMRSDGWKSVSSEPEKQSLIQSHSQSRSRSVSPSSRGPSPTGPQHTQQRSLGGYRPFMDTIPESSQPPSPTSIYTKKSPPQPSAIGQPGQLQLEYTNVPIDADLHSPLKPPPLRIRQGAEGGNNSTLLPSPKNMFSSVRLPFMSGASHKRMSSAGQSLATTIDEEQGMVNNRRTMESETLPAPGIPASSGRYRDSFWSVAASSILKTKGFQSTYGDSVYGAPGHTRSTSSSSGTHSRIASSGLGLGVDEPGVAAIPGRARSHSSVYSQRRPSEALIPALPPMPSQAELDQKQYGHKSGLQNQSIASIGSHASGPPGAFEMKNRLHSVDFWAREEQDMRLGAFAPAELEGSGSAHPTPIMEVPTPLEMDTPRDSRGMVIGAAMANNHRSSNPYFAGAMQGGYSVAIQGGDGPVRESTLMPEGYSHEHTDDGRRMWSRDRSRSRDGSRGRGKSRERESSSTVATVFKHHPGEKMLMI